MTGFDAAIHATFPQTEIQNCIIHQLRKETKAKAVEKAAARKSGCRLG